MASAPVRATSASPTPARLVLTPGANLLGLLAAIDDAPGPRVFLDAADLPRALQTRTILTVLRRRADRRGKRLHLVTASQTLWRLARLAELDGVAASEAAAVSLFEPQTSRMPADALPAVVIGAASDPDAARAMISAAPAGQAEPDVTGVPKVLGILARSELNLEPIPALGTDPMKSPEGTPHRELEDVPVPKLATLVAWLDTETRTPVTGGGGPGGPEGPDDESWLPAGVATGNRLPVPTVGAPQGEYAPRLRVVRVGQERALPRVRGGLALRDTTGGDGPDLPQDGPALTEPDEGSAGHTSDIGTDANGRPPADQPGRTTYVRRSTGRLLRSDSGRDRSGERVGRRSLNRDRLERLAGRGRFAAPSVRPWSGSTTTAATDQMERVRRPALGAETPDQAVKRAAVVSTVSAAVRATIRALVFVVGAVWRLVARVRLSGVAMVRLGAVAFVAAVIGAFTWFVVPSATIEFVPAVETWSTTLPVVVDPSARKPDAATGRIPGRWVVKEATDTRQASATGKRVVPDGKAGGDAVFTNRSERQVSVPKGTIVSGAGVRFATQMDVVVPPTLTVGPQKRLGVGRVAVIAEVGGTAGNLDRGKIASIEGPLAGQLDVQNDQTLRGGTERTVVFVSADDRRKLLETAQKGAIDNLAAQVKSLSIDPTKEIAVPLGVVGTPITVPGAQGPGVVEATFSKAENDEAASVSVTVKARYAVTVFETAAAQQVALSGATTMLAQQRPGFAPTGAPARAGTPEIGSVDATTGQVQMRLRVDATVAPVVSVSELRSAVAGRPIEEARAVLARVTGIASYRLTSWPEWSWKQTLPALGWRIGVKSATAPLPT